VVLGPVHDAAARPGVTPGRQILARPPHRHGFSPRINGEGRIATMRKAAALAAFFVARGAAVAQT